MTALCPVNSAGTLLTGIIVCTVSSPTQLMVDYSKITTRSYKSDSRKGHDGVSRYQAAQLAKPGGINEAKKKPSQSQDLYIEPSGLSLA